MQRKWAPEEIRILKERLLEKCVPREIADELGRTKCSVESYIKNNKLGNGRTGRPIDLERGCNILDGISKGLTIAAISRAMGLLPYSVLVTVWRFEKDGIVKRVNRRYYITQKWYHDKE